MTDKHVLNDMQAIFSEYGWPDALVSDNGPCNTAIEFRQVIDDMSVYHIMSSSHYHQIK